MEEGTFFTLFLRSKIDGRQVSAGEIEREREKKKKREKGFCVHMKRIEGELFPSRRRSLDTFYDWPSTITKSSFPLFFSGRYYGY